jgi:hypothetical protein
MLHIAGVTSEVRKEANMNTTQLEQLLQSIADEHLFITTLEPRHSDRLDFHEVSVWGVKAALLAAFEAGQAHTSQVPHTQP